MEYIVGLSLALGAPLLVLSAWLLQRPFERHVLPRNYHPVRPYVQIELDAASRAAGNAESSHGFHDLERAHVLSQVSTREHVRVHWRMMVWAIRQRDMKEFLGQLFRIVGAATKPPLVWCRSAIPAAPMSARSNPCRCPTILLPS